MADHHASSRRAIERTFKSVHNNDRIITHFVSSRDYTRTPFGMVFLPEHDKHNRIRRISIHVGKKALPRDSAQGRIAYNFARYAFVQGYANIKEQAEEYDHMMRIIKLEDETALGIIQDGAYDELMFPVERWNNTRSVRFAEETPPDAESSSCQVEIGKPHHDRTKITEKSNPDGVIIVIDDDVDLPNQKQKNARPIELADNGSPWGSQRPNFKGKQPCNKQKPLSNDGEASDKSHSRILQFIQKYHANKGWETLYVPAGSREIAILNYKGGRKDGESESRTFVFAAKEWEHDQTTEAVLSMVGEHSSITGIYSDTAHIFIFTEKVA